MDKKSLSELLAIAFAGTERFYEGPFDSKENLPDGFVETPVPDSLQPIIRLYGALGKELDELHNSFAKPDAGEPDEDTLRRHKDLHDMVGRLKDLIMAEMAAMDRPEGDFAGSTILAYDTMAWLPAPKFDDELPQGLGELLAALTGGSVKIEMITIGRGGKVRRSVL